jgi:hypothetical protein
MYGDYWGVKRRNHEKWRKVCFFREKHEKVRFCVFFRVEYGGKPLFFSENEKNKIFFFEKKFIFIFSKF